MKKIVFFLLVSVLFFACQRNGFSVSNNTQFTVKMAYKAGWSMPDLDTAYAFYSCIAIHKNKSYDYVRVLSSGMKHNIQTYLTKKYKKKRDFEDSEWPLRSMPCYSPEFPIDSNGYYCYSDNLFLHKNTGTAVVYIIFDVAADILKCKKMGHFISELQVKKEERMDKKS
jgi:hypothetical protein